MKRDLQNCLEINVGFEEHVADDGQMVGRFQSAPGDDCWNSINAQDLFQATADNVFFAELRDAVQIFLSLGEDRTPH